MSLSEVSTRNRTYNIACSTTCNTTYDTTCNITYNPNKADGLRSSYSICLICYGFEKYLIKTIFTQTTS